MRIALLLLLFFVQFQFQSQVALDLELFASGFDGPVALENAGDDRMFVVEQDGVIRVRQSDGTVSTFLDIQVPVNSNGNERGLLGLAFHPDYENNGYFFVNYTRSGGNSRISRFSVSADPDAADVTSEVIIMEIFQPYSNHNGGDIQFGPDGYLYIGMGDGGSAEDPDNYGQNTQSFLGKMLRIDIDNAVPGETYSIPADNPFINDDNVLDEIWALGLRNPWRYSFDAMTGDLWIGDVGQYDWEEISFQASTSPGGENYGWRCYEGNHPFNTSGCGPMSDYVDAIAEYSHSGGNCSVTGGFVYRGSLEPTLDGHYIFVDYCSGNFWTTFDNAGTWETNMALQTGEFGWSTFGVDMNNEMYVVNQNGNIFRIFDACVDYQPNFSVNGDILTAPDGSDYQWYLNGQIIPGATDQTYNILESGEYSLGMTSEQGCTGISQPLSVVYTSVGAIQLLTAINLFPNPTSEIVNLNIESVEQGEAIIELRDALGKLIWSDRRIIQTGMNSLEYNVRELETGFYVLTISTEKERHRISLIRD